MSKRRLLVTGRSAVYHVMSRMVRRQFWLGDGEREMFVRMVMRQAAFSGIEVLTHCVMGNHFHLLIRVPECPLGEAGSHKLEDEELLQRYEAYYEGRTPRSTYSIEELRALLGGDDQRAAEEARKRILARMGDLSVFMQELKKNFVIWFNALHENRGTIWESKFKSVLVQDAAKTLTKVAAYIDLNPVRAGLVEDPAEYRWSGYAAAMAGVEEAREGLSGLFTAHMNTSFERIIASYRLILYGVGAGVKRGSGTTGLDRGKIDRAAVGRILAAGGKVSLAEALRCRIRYFSDGGALGDAGFIAELFAEKRSFFGKSRKRGGAPLRGAIWDGLCAVRGLNRRVYD